MANYEYLIACPETKEAVWVDPAWDASVVLQKAQELDLTLKGLLVTHTHFDHVNKVPEVLKSLDLPVYIHEKEKSFIADVRENVRAVNGGESLAVGKLEVTFLHTPGHTPGSQCFLVGDCLVSGDTLFIDSCGRTDLPGGSPEEMFHSLQRLKSLPDETILYPGHNYAPERSTTLGSQKQRNPVLLYDNLQQFLAMF